MPAWVEVLTGTTGRRAGRRRSGQAASAGAALLAASTVGAGFDLDTMDPVADVSEPDPAAVDRYAGLRAHAEQVARTVLDLAGSGPPAAGLPPPVPTEPACG